MQYDLLLIQNTHATLVEYTEKFVNLAKGSLLTSGAAGAVGALAVGADGTILVPDAASALGMKYVSINTLVTANSHAQNTDAGTSALHFDVNMSGFDIELTAESATKFGVKTSGQAGYADIQAGNATFAKVTVAAAPVSGTDVPNKTYVDGIVVATKAMRLLGGLGVGDTLTSAAFTALTSYNAGDTYKVTTAATYTAKDGDTFNLEVGDMIIAMQTRSGSGWATKDWFAEQTNIVGAVTNVAGGTNDNIAFFGAGGNTIHDNSITLTALQTAMTAANAAAVNLSTHASTITGVHGLLISVGKTFSLSNSLTLAGTDGSTLNIGAGGTLAAGAYAAAAVAADINTGTDTTKWLTAAALAGSLQVKGTGAAVANRIAVYNDASGKVITDGGKLISDLMNTWVAAPASKSAAGTAGQMAYDGNYFYVCTAASTWKRNAIATNW